MGHKLRSPLGNISDNPKDTNSRKVAQIVAKIAAVAAVSIVLGVSGVFSAGVSFIGDTFLSIGANQLEQCASNSTVSLAQSVNSSGQTEIDAVTIEGIPSTCDGAVVSLTIYNSSSQIIDEVIWTLELTVGDTEISAVADGTTTDSSNSSSGGVSTNYPASQTDPEGLEQNLLSSNVGSVTFLNLETTRAAQE